MSDSLVIFGKTWNNAAGIKATDTNDDTLTFIKPTGTKSITQNGTGIDVSAYQYANVSVNSEFLVDYQSAMIALGVE